MKKALHNSLNWATQSKILASGSKIILAHIGDDAYAYIKNNYPNAILNNKGSCDGDALSKCLTAEVDLLVIGNGGNCSTRVELLKQVKQQAINILYISPNWRDDQCTNATMNYYQLTSADDYSNYFARTSLENKNMLAENSTEEKLAEIIRRLEHNDFSTQRTQCNNFVGKVNCTDPSLYSEFLNDVNALRNHLRTLDAKNTKLFDQDSVDIYRMMVLLGDKYREEISYPIDKKTDSLNWYKALFANSTVYNNRAMTTVEKNLGDFVTKKDNPPILPSQTITLKSSPIKRIETAVGVYVWPGKTITITRKDNNNAKVSTSINMIRDTTRIYNDNGYRRPHYISTPQFELKPGASIQLSNPYGGPVYFQINKTNDTETIVLEIE